MDRGVSSEGEKRRLPLWMLGVSAADQVSKSEKNGDLNKENLEDAILTKSSLPKLRNPKQNVEGDSCLITKRESKGRKRKLGRNHVGAKEDVNSDSLDEGTTSSKIHQPDLRDKEGSLDADSFLLVECETKRRKRKLSRSGVVSDGNACGAVGLEDEKYAGVATAVRRSSLGVRRKAKSFTVESSEEIETQSASEDDSDLTMEDLMSIAKEYVEGYKDSGQLPSDGQNYVTRQHQVVVSTRSESKMPLDGPRYESLPPKHKQEAYVPDNSTSDKVVVNPSRTGDTTQDMLDLFLGPLLKKPTEDKKITPISDDITFDYEFKPKIQDILGEQVAPVMKKKSSLKDKVALLLD